MSESPAACPHRESSPAGEGAVCGLLAEISGTIGIARDRCGVESSTCVECGKWFPPTNRKLNPVVASLLYNQVQALPAEGLIHSPRREKVQELKERAMHEIADAKEYVSVQEIATGQKNLDLESVEELLPLPATRSGERVKTWAVGVTTAPREQSTLSSCLESLAAAGWNDYRVFVDGDTDWEAVPKEAEVTHRKPKVGAWSSYFLALGELLMRSPDADAYLLVQDDVVLFRHPQLRSYLETALWPGESPGIVSLYCSRAYTRKDPGWHTSKKRMVWGGQALVFSREALLAFLGERQVVQHRLTKKGDANIDVLIGAWAKSRGVEIYFPTPSLAQHIGHVSSIWPKARLTGNRRASRFAGEEGA